MLVSKQHKKLILNLREPEQVLALIPGAKLLHLRGHKLVAVKHDLDTVRVLRNLGFPAPSPVLAHYTWPGRHTPKPHQLDTVEFLTLNPRAYCLNGMGSGKTLCVLWAFDYLKSVGQVDWMCVVSTLSTLELVWGNEVFASFPEMTHGVVHGTPARKQRILADPYDVYIINHDGVKNAAVVSAIRNKPGRGLIVIDELAVCRNGSTDVFRWLKILTNGINKPKMGLDISAAPWVWGLTGTPQPKEPTDVWAQCKLVTPGTVPESFKTFRDMVMKPVGPFKWRARDNAEAIVHAAMQPSIRFATEDCIELPPTTISTVEVPMSAQQNEAYGSMMRKLTMEFEEGRITALNAAVQVGKLLQVVCGVVYAEGQDVRLDVSARLAEVVAQVRSAKAKTIVFVPLSGALRLVEEELAKHFSCAVVHGGVSKSGRGEVFNAFSKRKDPQVLIAQPRTMAHGLELTAADKIVWYAPYMFPDVYQQANARPIRAPQKLPTSIVHLCGSPVERKLYATLQRREAAQNFLLDLFRADSK